MRIDFPNIMTDSSLTLPDLNEKLKYLRLSRKFGRPSLNPVSSTPTIQPNSSLKPPLPKMISQQLPSLPN